ncbi:HAD family hydrolase [Phaeacidiphilus oryzae]|uniref:HAD family hydrolase n=1 Tax=Phaeacidiphilus oryzae TaxID=348818 RepID=UPI00055A31A9|nr:HAD family hydrolase [Phaeacidiphilus oryzae]
MADRVVLWDLDHTLLATQGVGRDCFADAFEQVTGRPLENPAEVTGKSEAVIFRETLAAHGLPRDAWPFEEYAEALAAAYLRRAGELRARGHALPGAAAALDALAQLADTVQVPATGNARRVAEIKVATFGLDQHLDLTRGAYGEDADDRPDMVRVALQRAEAPAAAAILFGDTPADVTAGRDVGVFTVGVATGRTPATELEDAGADVVLADLTDTERVVALTRDLAASRTGS